MHQQGSGSRRVAGNGDRPRIGILALQGDVGERALRLESSRSFPSGLVQLRYATGRDAPRG